ncbi:MAG: TIGR03936 family radical SAM-associated protein [Candidatus Omnitrophica bacterium]|nr:TIGR03936 family radical SAM-associated protein [Candidatus Omnitrophota bacterium]
MYRLRIFYRKEGIARFISERNFQRVIERILRKMELPLKFTEGFSPHPKMSFGHPLPIGIAGINECFDIFLINKIDINLFLERSREILPDGISFISCCWVKIEAPSIHKIETFAKYTIELTKGENIEDIRKIGKIVEHKEGKVVLEIKINNFSHRELTKLFLEHKIGNIVREICVLSEDSQQKI